MLLNKVLDENAIVEEDINLSEADELELTSAYGECLANIEQLYGETMLEQAKDEFKQYVTEGTIDNKSDGLKAKIKSVVDKIWEFIKKYYNKILAFVRKATSSAYQYFKVHKSEIEEGADKVKDFKGCGGLKNFNSITKFVNSLEAKFKTFMSNVNTLANFDSEASKKMLDELRESIVPGCKSNLKMRFAVAFAACGAEFNDAGDLKALFNTNVSYTFKEISDLLGSHYAEDMIAATLKITQSTLNDAKDSAKADHIASKGENPNTNYYSSTIINGANLISKSISDIGHLIPSVIKQADKYQHKAVAAVKKSADNSDTSNTEEKNESATNIMNSDDAKAYLESIGLA